MHFKLNAFNQSLDIKLKTLINNLRPIFCRKNYMRVRNDLNRLLVKP